MLSWDRGGDGLRRPVQARVRPWDLSLLGTALDMTAGQSHGAYSHHLFSGVSPCRMTLSFAWPLRSFCLDTQSDIIVEASRWYGFPITFVPLVQSAWHIMGVQEIMVA